MEPVSPPKICETVAAAFGVMPIGEREKLMRTRARIFALAAETDGVGPLTEALRWGQPSYLTQATGAGSTLRLGLAKDAGGAAALFLICQTPLVEQARARFGSALTCIGNRAIVIPDAPSPELDLVILSALTYKLG